MAATPPLPTPPLPPGTALLRAEKLVRRYGERTVVDVDELEVADGEVLGVLGPNGAGKSTLFRLLLMLEAPDSGRILFRGRPVSSSARDSHGRQARARMAGVFQRPVLFSGTVRHNLDFALRAQVASVDERRGRVDALLEALGLADRASDPARSLSGGEAQRVALARALVLRPDVLMLDEPTANLDVSMRRGFRNDLERLVRAEARACVLITHDPAEAFALASRIVVLQEGRVVQSGTPDELILRPATAFIAEFTGAELLIDGVVEEAEPPLATVRLTSGGGRIRATMDSGGPLARGGRVHVAYRPEDVILAPANSHEESSPRNRYVLTVATLSPIGGLVRVRLEGEVPLTALVTRDSATELRLAEGTRVAVRLKAVAVRAFPAS